MKRRRKTPKHTHHIKAHLPTYSPYPDRTCDNKVTPVWRQLPSPLATIPCRVEAEVLSTAFGALQDWPHFIFDLFSHLTSPVASPATLVSSNIPGPLLPQGLCTSWSLCLQCSPPSSLRGLLLNLLQSFLKCYILSEAFSELFVYNYIPPTTPFP